MEKLTLEIDKLASTLLSPDNKLMVLAEEEETEVLERVALACQMAGQILKSALVREDLGNEDVDNLAALAAQLSESDDPEVQKIAASLDKTLATMAGGVLYQENNDYYRKSIGAEKAIKAIENKVKEYRPNEAPLKTRSCPEHPGNGLIRISDDEYQCSLDKKIFDYKNGYTLVGGGKVPGGDVAMQSHVNDNRPTDMNFSTRESRNQQM